MNNVRVPFLDLTGQHKPHMAEYVEAFQQVVETSAFAGGRFVEAFEKDFATYCRTSEAVAVGNGTDAIWFALLALGAMTGLLVPALWIIALGSAFTVAQRFSKAYQAMERIDASERAALRERG